MSCDPKNYKMAVFTVMFSVEDILNSCLISLYRTQATH